MGNVAKPNTFTASTTIASSEVNANFDTIYNEFNGSIEAANLASGAVTTAKIADSAVTAAKISDDAVTAAKINWAGTGANGGIWWEEIGRTTLGSAGDTITVDSLPARKYLKILFWTNDTGGSIAAQLQFNNDTGSNYAFRNSINGAADTTSTSSAYISVNASSGGAFATQGELFIVNVASEEKTVTGFTSTSGSSTGAANLPTRKELTGKWANTSNQITRVDITNGAAGDFAIGSEVVVLGHD